METVKICQCCLVNSCYKNINSEYYWCGEPVIYAKLLKDTFNITIPSEDCNYICDRCVNKIQDATTFRRQVVKVQVEMQRMFTRNDIENTPISPINTNAESVENANSVIGEDSLWEIDKDGDENHSDFHIHTTEMEPIKFNNNTANIELTKFRTSIFENKCAPTLKNLKKFKIKKEIREHSLTLLKYSNICLFKSLKTRFQCYMCKETFLKISHLREHTKVHSSIHSGEFKMNLLGHTFKNVDISNLTCTLCTQQCNELNDLTKHLHNEHSIVSTTTEHMFIPYRLEEGFRCVICEENFNTFVPLSTHMNKHTTNNVCEICGVSFINRLSLRTHIQSMHRVKKCTLCSANFDKNYEKVKHMKMVHNIGTSKRYCVLCNMTFRHSYMLEKHRIDEHGLKRQLANCPQCSKTFLTPQNLKVHIRSVHIKERNYQCDVCGMRFFTKRDETRHKRRHEDVKSFSCNHCEGRFKSKDSWRRHLRRLHSINC